MKEKILRINLQNCYGIKELKQEFDFSKNKTLYIYAPNGTMKTSFAKSFRKEKPNDSINKYEPIRNIVWKEFEQKEEDLAKNFYVFAHETNQSHNWDLKNILISSENKEAYDKYYANIKSKLQDLLSSLAKETSIDFNTIKENIIEDLELEINEDNSFTISIISFFESKSYKNNDLYDFSKIVYKDFFTDSNIEITKQDSFQEYIKVYEELMSNSNIFKNEFNYFNIEKIEKSLKDNNFFNGKNKIFFGDNEIKKENELKELIEKETRSIRENSKLKSIGSKIVKNKNTRAFWDKVQKDSNLLLRLNDIKKLKKEFWQFYFKIHEKEIEEIVNAFKGKEDWVKNLVRKIKEDKENWKNVIEIYNERFIDMPFSFELENGHGITLEEEEPRIKWFWNKGPDNKKIEIDENKIRAVISEGEKRAKNILNLIFEFEKRKKQNQECIFVIDDIAESFDYKNKYAIIEYLQEINKEENFYQIILTHNYDFFRLAFSRIPYKEIKKFRAMCILVQKDKDQKIIFKSETYHKNPLVGWRKSKDEYKTLAAIPMLRNIIEYKDGPKSNHYNILTKCLHVKKEKVGMDDYLKIFKKFFNVNETMEHISKGAKVHDRIIESSNKIIEEYKVIKKLELEHKIVLSMAIRLMCENYIINTIESDFEETGSNQTRWLIEKYIEKNKDIEESERRILNRVNLITPEYIHINSFSYESLIDTTSEALKKLHSDISELYEKTIDKNN